MSTKGPTNHKPISVVESRESSLSKASETKFCSLYQLSPRELTFFINTFCIACYCLAVMTLPFGNSRSTFGRWFCRLVVSFQISPAEFESSTSSMLLLFRKLCISIAHSYSGNRVSAHVFQAPCATFVLNLFRIRAESFLPSRCAFLKRFLLSLSCYLKFCQSRRHFSKMNYTGIVSLVLNERKKREHSFII